MKSFTSYDLTNKEYPQRLPPWKLILVKGLSTLAKFGLPLVLESIYKNLQQQNNQTQSQQTLLSILLKITISLSLSYFLELYCQYILVDYRLNLKKELSKRILQNIILTYYRSKKQSTFHINETGTHHQIQQNKKHDHQKQESFHAQKLSIWNKISNKMPVYVYNYHNSLLSLFFQSLNIIGVSTYLFMKLSYSLFFGLIFALIIMRKIVNVTKQIQQRFFNNIQLRQKKLILLKNFFNHLVQYKMTWLDKWIFDKVQKCEDDYQNNLQKIKYLDVWCVALWRFTSVSLSSIVVIAFYFLGIKATQIITPSTLIQFLMILTMPLNALSWNIAGVRNSLRAILQLKQVVTPLIHTKKQQKQQISKKSAAENQFKLLKSQQIKIQFDQQNRSQVYVLTNDIPIRQRMFIQARGKKEVEYFLTVLPFVLKNNTSSQIGYVQENSWQIDNILQSLTFKNVKILQSSRKEFPQLVQLLQIFVCHQIPQFSSITSKNLSGGQKMRINLVRAFFNSKIIIINSDLTSLDLKMRQKVAFGINYLIKRYGYCVFCKEIQAINQDVFQNKAQITFNFKRSIDDSFQKQQIFEISYNTLSKVSDQKQFNSQKVQVSQQIVKKFVSSLKDQKRKEEQTQRDEDSQRSKLGKQSQKNIDNLQWETFTSYYKSKYHIIFLIGIISTTFFQHLYQFYMNNYVKIQHIHDGSGLSAQNVKNIVILTLLFVTALFIRAYYFAVASIKESKRLAKQLDQNIIMNEMDFYQNFTQKSVLPSEKQNQQVIPGILNPLNEQQNEKFQISKNTKGDNQQSQGKKTSELASKLIYHCTTDLAQVSDNYPWQANILFNNIATTLSSILIVFSQIPFIGIILIPIITFTVLWNNQYQKQSQRLLKVQKKVQENLLKTVHQIEQGIKVIYLYRKIDDFKQFIYKSIDKQINIEWKLNELKRKLNAKYKLMMIGFLIIIVLTFGLTGHIKNQDINDDNLQNNPFKNFIQEKFGKCDFKDLIFNTQERNKSGKFAMLINYTITLANFMLFFTVSLGDTFNHALSIQRLRPLLSGQNSLKSEQRLRDFQKVLQKIKKNTKIVHQNLTQDTMISIKSLDFSYNKKNGKANNNKVFSDLDFELRWKQKVQLRGKSGEGKTTLYKILCSLYKDKLNTIDYPFYISFSPQHPLILPATKTVTENLDPYGIFTQKSQNQQPEISSKQYLRKIIINQLSRNSNEEYSTIYMKLINQLLDKSIDSLTYEQKIITNNLRTWLYGKNGIKIYDQPYWVDQSQQQTYIITTHQRQFKSSKSLYLENKKLSLK